MDAPGTHYPVSPRCRQVSNFLHVREYYVCRHAAHSRVSLYLLLPTIEGCYLYSVYFSPDALTINYVFRVEDAYREGRLASSLAKNLWLYASKKEMCYGLHQ
jgi:hypothetical protein